MLRLRSLLNAVWLLCLSVRHLRVLWLFRRRRVSLLLGLGFPLCALKLGLLGSVLLLLLLHDRLSLALDLVVVALDDGAGDGADILLLGNILCLGRVVALVI
jgi:hypothetical protein